MIKLICLFLLSCLSITTFAQKGDAAPNATTKKIILFNGKNLESWEGTNNILRVHRGAIVGGNKKDTIAQNEFLSITSSYKNFDLEVKFKIKGYGGFIKTQLHYG